MTSKYYSEQRQKHKSSKRSNKICRSPDQIRLSFLLDRNGIFPFCKNAHKCVCVCLSLSVCVANNYYNFYFTLLAVCGCCRRFFVFVFVDFISFSSRNIYQQRRMSAEWSKCGAVYTHAYAHAHAHFYLQVKTFSVFFCFLFHLLFNCTLLKRIANCTSAPKRRHI